MVMYRSTRRIHYSDHHLRVSRLFTPEGGYTRDLWALYTSRWKGRSPSSKGQADSGHHTTNTDSSQVPLPSDVGIRFYAAAWRKADLFPSIPYFSCETRRKVDNCKFFVPVNNEPKLESSLHEGKGHNVGRLERPTIGR